MQHPGSTLAGDAAEAQRAQVAIAQREWQAAIELLEAVPETRRSADKHALLAQAYFQAELYARAAEQYALALAASPGHDDWREMLALSQANATAHIHEPVPPFAYFSREALLAPPSVRDGDLPEPPPPLPDPDGVRALRIAVGHALGVVATALVEGVMHAWGRLAGYRDRIWTNWYHRPVALGVLTLAYMRERLNARNLGTSYPPGSLVGFQTPGQAPPVGVTHFRTADGSWNNLRDPKEGAAGTRFLRNVDLAAVRPERGEQLLTPNPRLVSRVLLTRETGDDGTPRMKEVPFLNLLSASWIQFMNADWINHGEIHHDRAIHVPLPPDDPARERYWQTHMFVGTSQEDPTRTPGVEVASASAINEVTHWWDGSQLYGSDLATQHRLRSHEGGHLRLQADGRLPLHPQLKVEDTGFHRNWWLGVAMLHNLFAREHNAICDELARVHPGWNDDRLFNVARLVNAAVMAKIHTVEWTPAILPNPALNVAMNANWYGLLTNFMKRGKARRTLGEVKVDNPELGGVVGDSLDKHGRGFGLTEEFVEVYRLHSLLPETLVLQRRDGTPLERVPFQASRQRGSVRLTERHAMADLFFSFGRQHPGQLVLNNYPRFMQSLSIPGNPFFDMGTVDLLRARERGVPRYNEFRRQLGLNPIDRFEALTDDLATVEKLKSVYGRDPAAVEQLDLMIGTLAEAHRPTGFGFGETMFQIFILNATRRLQADRFYTDAFNEEVYTETGLRWIDAVDFKTVLLRHHPELADTGLANIRNAFEPWDDDATLDPLRHPLRAFDPELEDTDPWTGDAHRAHPR